MQTTLSIQPTTRRAVTRRHLIRTSALWTLQVLTSLF
jgi:hypothetical protein